MARRYVRMAVKMIAEQPIEPERENYVRGQVTAFLNDNPTLQAGEVKVEFDWLGPVEILTNNYAKPWVDKVSTEMGESADELDRQRKDKSLTERELRITMQVTAMLLRKWAKNHTEDE